MAIKSSRQGLRDIAITISVVASVGLSSNLTYGYPDTGIPAAPRNDNLPPNPPVLLHPANSGISYLPNTQLSVMVSDPEADTLQVKFYGRRKDAAPPFRIVVLPDTQKYSASYPATFTQQTQWIIDNRTALNIAAVAHVGDIVDNATLPQQWQNANAALSRLDTQLDLPYGLAIGNHDQNPAGDPNGTAIFNTYFPYTRYQARAWCGGHYGTNNDNHYILFSAAGADFIILFLEYDTSTNPASLSWAKTLLQTYANRRAIVTCHSVLNTNATWTTQGATLYNALKACPNLFMILCGHSFGENLRTDTNNGHTIYTLLADFQEDLNGGNGYLRLLEFVPAENIIRVKTYSPMLRQYQTDSNSEFTLPYDLGGNPPFEELGTIGNLPGGAQANFLWLNRTPSQSYDWCASVSDSYSTTTGPTWSFQSATLLGDLNCDGNLHLGDLRPFVVALLDPEGYPSLYPGCDPNRADMNSSQTIDGLDIQLFVQRLLSTPPITPLDISTFVAVLLGMDTDPTRLALADMNQDGIVDGLDITLYVKAVLEH